MLLDVTPVWETKHKSMESIEAQGHLWQYYTDLGKRRGTQAVRNGGAERHQVCRKPSSECIRR